MPRDVGRFTPTYSQLDNGAWGDEPDGDASGVVLQRRNCPLCSADHWHPNLDIDAWLQTEVPVLPPDEQRRIADFLDDQVARIDNIIAARRTQLDLIAQALRFSLDSLFDGPPRALGTMLTQSPCYGVLVPKFVDDGVPFIRVNDLNRLGDGHELAMIDKKLPAEYQRTVVETGGVLLSVVFTWWVRSTRRLSSPRSAPERAGANVARAVARLGHFLKLRRPSCMGGYRPRHIKIRCDWRPGRTLRSRP